MSRRSLLIDILSRRDPHGYFVIPLKVEGKDLVEKIISQYGESSAKIVESHEAILVRVKSRSVAEKIIRAAEKRSLLLIEEED
ncbi:MAG: hypothetical protein QXG74_01605 [Acidilobaceae archaeon]